MLNRPVRPAWIAKSYYPNAKKEISVVIVIPDGVQPMDIWNMCSAVGIVFSDIYYGWIDNKGVYMDAETSAQAALEYDLLDKKVERLTVEDYQGYWKNR